MKSCQIQQNSTLTYCILTWLLMLPGIRDCCYLVERADRQSFINTQFTVLSLVHLLNMLLPDVTTLIATSHQPSVVCRVNLSLLAVFTWSLRTKGVVCGLWVHCQRRATIACHHMMSHKTTSLIFLHMPHCHTDLVTNLSFFMCLRLWLNGGDRSKMLT